MPYFLMSSGPEPVRAADCTVICNSNMALKLMARFEAKKFDSQVFRAEPRVRTLLDRAFSLLGWSRLYTEEEEDVPRYYVPSSPHTVMNFIEQEGYKLNATATNKSYFLWTFHKEEPSGCPLYDRRPLPQPPDPSPPAADMDRIGLEIVELQESPRRNTSHLEYVDMRAEAMAARPTKLQETGNTLAQASASGGHQDVQNLLFHDPASEEQEISYPELVFPPSPEL